MRAAATAATVVLAGALASCSNASTSGASGSSGGTAPSPSPSFIPGPISSGAPTTFAPLPTPTVTSAPACKDGQVIVSVMGGGAGGTFFGTVTMTAVDGTTCSVVGYPRLAVVDRAGQVGSKATVVKASPTDTPMNAPTGTSSTKEVILGRNTSAIASFTWLENPATAGASCPVIVGVEVTPPGLHTVLKPALQASGGGAVLTQLCGPPAVAYVVKP